MSGLEKRMLVSHAIDQVEFVAKRLIRDGTLTEGQLRTAKSAMLEVWNAAFMVSEREAAAAKLPDPFEEPVNA